MARSIEPTNSFVSIDGWGRVMKMIEGWTLKGTAFAQFHVIYGDTNDLYYGVYVHENLQAYHAPPTQAKFLEAPARQFANEISTIIAERVKNKKSIVDAVRRGANFLFQESQRLVPVETGALRRSGRIEYVM